MLVPFDRVLISFGWFPIVRLLSSLISRVTFSITRCTSLPWQLETTVFCAKRSHRSCPRILMPISTPTHMPTPSLPSCHSPTTRTANALVTNRPPAFDAQLQSKLKKQLPPQLQQRLALPMSTPTSTPNMLSQPGISNSRMRQTLPNKSHNFHPPVPNGLTSFQESFAFQ